MQEALRFYPLLQDKQNCGAQKGAYQGEEACGTELKSENSGLIHKSYNWNMATNPAAQAIESSVPKKMHTS